MARQVPTSFQELHGLLADHDFMVKKSIPAVAPIQAFATTSSIRSTPMTTPPDALQTLQQLASQLGFQINPAPASSPQAFYTNCPSSSRGRTLNNRRGRGNYTQPSGGTRNNQFPWASSQNTVYGTCNRCGIGHIPSQCPNRDPTTIRSRQQPTTLSIALSLPHGFPTLVLAIMFLMMFPLLTATHPTLVRTRFMLAMDNTTKTTLLTGPSNNELYSVILSSLQSLPKVAFTTFKASSAPLTMDTGVLTPPLTRFTSPTMFAFMKPKLIPHIPPTSDPYISMYPTPTIPDTSPPNNSPPPATTPSPQQTPISPPTEPPTVPLVTSPTTPLRVYSRRRPTDTAPDPKTFSVPSEASTDAATTRVRPP
ncbi:uncharacterized protein LOC128128866 [Lactuca sativa]|uniref:uncharacterized protein LOC128128866 n=1 Tax=Lactuca sativa TaxID=4236 RepID=UPI0022B06DBD|nr:uncharacterized protein LOC128128866 [Lactuca sativa]